MLLYHGPQSERAKVLKEFRRPQGSLGMLPVVVTSFEISMIDRKFLQVIFQVPKTAQAGDLCLLHIGRKYGFGIIRQIKNYNYIYSAGETSD